MQHKYHEELDALNESLQSTQDLLSSMDIPELNAVKSRLSERIRKEQFFIGSLLGTTANVAATQPLEVKPLTHVFGKPLKVNADKPVKAADAAPSTTEKQKFRAEVDDYYKNFLNLTDEDLFNKANPLVIRAVAKRAGYAEYETSDINIDYLNAVRAAITVKNDDQKALDEADAKLKAEKTKK
jgi:hypothetical protein